MTKPITWEFIAWVELHFGLAGQMFVLFFAISVIVGLLSLAQRHLAPVDQGLCNDCRFINPNENCKVYGCPQFAKCGLFQMRTECPHIQS
jgi:hypothetical protein